MANAKPSRFTAPATALPVDAEPGSGLQQLMVEQHGFLAGLLAAMDQAPDEAVHETRKCVKRLRALLRLCCADTEGGWGRQDAEYRALGDLLSGNRDAGVMLQTLQALGKRRANGHAAPSPEQAPQAALNASLRDHQVELSAIVELGGRHLARCEERLPQLFDGAVWSRRNLFDNYLESYREARRAFRRARARPTASRMHRWRRRVQRHLNQTRVLLPLLPPALAARAQGLDRLAEKLGDNNDYAVFQRHLGRHRAELRPRSTFRTLQRRAAERGRKRAQQSLELGEGLFRDRTKGFQAALHEALALADIQPDIQAESATPAPAQEIERKFLVDPDAWARLQPRLPAGLALRQGYLNAGEAPLSLRVRRAGDQAWFTIKSTNAGPVRTEVEFDIPVTQAETLLAGLCRKPLVEKTRYQIVIGGLNWVLDAFGGDNEGLVLAEVELDSPEQEVPLPPWIIQEVTGDRRYYNDFLAVHPYSAWR